MGLGLAGRAHRADRRLADLASARPRRPDRAGFLAAIPLRVAVCCIAGMLLVSKYPICAETFFVWLGLFYLATMLKESAWLSAALNRDADRVSLGELRRPCRQIWERHRIR